MNDLIERISQTYDEVPYTSAAFPVSAPEHLRAVAHLFGLSTPSAERARVLELGCASGGNLIPFAVRHPGAEVVGVDLSPVQIDTGRRLVETMGLSNVRLIQGSLTDLDASLGKFDYIVCHGVYSWVPDDVRAAILRVCRELLADDGVAYVSYNTYPGWKAKEIVRDAMLLRAAHGESARDQLAYARGMIEFLHEQAKPQTVLATVMGEHIETIRGGDDAYLAHEYLELCNAPCYFRDFVSGARAQGLEYLGDATAASMFASNYGAAAPALLAECGGDQVALEQMVDFLENRNFRQTLLVHAHRGAQVRYRIEPDRIASLHVAGRFVRGEADGDGIERWTSADGPVVTAASVVTRTVLERLNAAWPSTLAVAELLSGFTMDDAAQALDLVTRLVTGNAVRFRSEPLVAGALSDRPFVRDAVRALAQASAEEAVLFNEWHQPTRLGAMERFLLPLLDGKADLETLVHAVLQAVAQRGLAVMRDGKRLEDAEEIAASVRRQVIASLRALSRDALFAVAPATDVATPAAKPAAKPTGKSAVKTVDKPAVKATDKPAAKPAAKPAVKPAVKPKPAKAEASADKPKPRGKK